MHPLYLPAETKVALEQTRELNTSSNCCFELSLCYKGTVWMCLAWCSLILKACSYAWKSYLPLGSLEISHVYPILFINLLTFRLTERCHIACYLASVDWTSKQRDLFSKRLLLQVGSFRERRYLFQLGPRCALLLGGEKFLLILLKNWQFLMKFCNAPPESLSKVSMDVDVSGCFTR